MYNYRDSHSSDTFEKLVNEFIEFKKSKGEEPVLPVKLEECISEPEQNLYVMNFEENTPQKATYSIPKTHREEQSPYFASEAEDYLNKYYDPGVLPEEDEEQDEIMLLDSDMDYMRLITGDINQRLYPIMVDILNEYEYEGSPLLEKHIDRETIHQIVDKVLEKAAESIEDVEEIHLDAERNPWCRYRLLRSLTEINILNELYGCRRPRYRRVLYKRPPMWY